MVFDDQTNTITGLKRNLAERGFKPEVSSNPELFNKRLKAVPSDHCGWLIDNHIENCRTLKDFGEPKVDTENGSLAGYRIISNILLPRMRAGQLPRRPIGLMSRRDLGRAKSLFKDEFRDREAVFFFSKEDSPSSANSELRLYLEALRNCVQAEQATSPLGRDGVAARMVQSFQEWAGISDEDLDQIFRVRGKRKLAKQLASGRVELGTDTWQEMAVLLSRIQIGLSRVFSNSPDPKAAARQWLNKGALGKSNESPIALLLTGEFISAYSVLDAALFAAELS